MFYRYHDSPLGPLLLAADEAGLRRVQMEPEQPAALPGHWRPADRQLDQTCLQLDEYFAGQRTGFELPLAPVGTAFQQAVWRELQRIPPGETRTYAEIAAAAGNPRAVRAAGSANARNNVAVLIPCHRVIRSDGDLGGYAYGLDIKRELLRREGVDS